MRRGEIAGLKWQDIDMKRATLHVQRSLTRVPTTMGGGYQEAKPKTEKSRRSIVLPDFACAALKKHRTLQGEIKQQAASTGKSMTTCSVHLSAHTFTLDTISLKRSKSS